PSPARDGKLGLLSRRQRGDLHEQRSSIWNGLAVDRAYHICRSNSGALRRTAWHNTGDERAGFLGYADLSPSCGRDVLHLHAQPATADSSRSHQLLDDRFRHAHRYCKADAERSSALGIDRRIDADQVAAAVHQRAARITWVDRRVGLDEVLDRIDADAIASRGAHDSHRDRL